MEGKLSLFIDYRMSGIAAALIADDHIVVLCEQIDHPALAFITPVDADDCTHSHFLSPLF